MPFPEISYVYQGWFQWFALLEFDSFDSALNSFGVTAYMVIISIS